MSDPSEVRRRQASKRGCLDLRKSPENEWLMSAASPSPVRAVSALARIRWRRALVAYRSADAAFWPVRARFDAAERRYFAQLRGAGELSKGEDDLLRGLTGLTEAEADEGAYGNAMHRAARILYQTPAPDLQALICKVEILLAMGHDGPSEAIILADLRRFVRRRRP